MPLALRPLHTLQYLFVPVFYLVRHADASPTRDGDMLHVNAALLGKPSHTAHPPAVSEGLGDADLFLAMRNGAG